MAWKVIALAVALAGPAQEPPPEPAPKAKAYGLPIEGEAAEAFLKTAEVVERKSNPEGVTHSERLTLSDGIRTLRAARKTVDVFNRGTTQFLDGTIQVDFRDSWKFEVAAYELDKLLGLGLVPPTVERTIDKTPGSLQMWVEGAVTTAGLQERKLEDPDPEHWNRQVYNARLLRQLTYDTDSTNINNELIDSDFRIHAIDFTRAFRTSTSLRSEDDLVRFSRSALDGLARLDRATLQDKLGRWLNAGQIYGLLKRRDRILALAKKRVAETGEAAVLYP
jgi:hypothetical protein